MKQKILYFITVLTVGILFIGCGESDSSSIESQRENISNYKYDPALDGWYDSNFNEYNTSEERL